MNDPNYQYAKGRYVNPRRIIEASVYKKQADTPDDTGNYPVIWRVAISLDVKETEKSTVYSDAFKTEEEANKHAASVPTA